MAAGWVVVLNGAPRSGKSSIAAVIQETFDGPWMNLGVDVFSRHVTPPRYRPGMGLRPGGGERPDIEALIPALYAAFYDSVAAHARRGLPALLVGVRCPIEEIMRRRDASPPGRYAASGPDGEIPDPVLRWQHHVHQPGIYDLEIDTSALTPQAAAATIRTRLAGPPPTAFRQLAADPARD
jgi:chloramphenicol 3-O phosphotransferase